MKSRFMLIIVVISLVLTGLAATEILFCPENSPETIEVSWNEVIKYFESELFQEKLSSNFYADIIVDKTYFLSSLADHRRFIMKDNLNKHSYIEERFDCDDFGYALKVRGAEKGLTFGIVAVNFNETDLKITDTKGEEENHILNIFLTKETGKLKGYLVEPQTDEIIALDDFREGKILYIWF